VTVRLTGSFGVTRGGATVFGPRVGSRKARRLLMLLAVHRGQFVGVDRIVDALWDERLPREPDRNVATLVSRLRAMLGSEVITGGREGYRLGMPPAVRVDVDAAAELVAEAARRLAGGEPAFAVTAAWRALEMLGTGSLLVGEADREWIAAARVDAQSLVREARHTAAAAALLVDDPATAAQVAADAVAADSAVTKAYVTGQDADKASIQAIIDGRQGMTVFKDPRTLARDTVAAAGSFLQGRTPAATRSYNNGTINVPFKTSAIVVVTSRRSRLERASIRLFGPPTVQVGSVLGWRR